MPRSLMIFAAGFGTRMGDLTRDIPKPMLPVGGVPMIDHAIEIGRSAGVDQIAANTHYLAKQIEPHLLSKGVSVHREEPEILDTGGGLKAAGHLLVSPTFTLNPDVGWQGPNPLLVMCEAWRPEYEALLLVVPVKRARNRVGAGDFFLDGMALRRGGDFVYTGAQIIRLSALDDIGEAAFSLNLVWDRLEAKGQLRGVVYPGAWLDIGTPDGLDAAESFVMRQDV